MLTRPYTTNKPSGTISPHSLSLQPRVFRTSHSFPLTSSSSHPHAHQSNQSYTSYSSLITQSSALVANSSEIGVSSTFEDSYGSNVATYHPSEYVPRHAPIPEDWMIQLPSSPVPCMFVPEVSLLIPDYDGPGAEGKAKEEGEEGMSESDKKLFKAASALLAEDQELLGQPRLIDFTSSQPQPRSLSQSQAQVQVPTQGRGQVFRGKGPFRTSNSQPLNVISPFRIHPYSRRPIKEIPTSSPDSDESFDTPLSVRQKRRRNAAKPVFSVGNRISLGKKDSMGEETFYGLEKRDDEHTPSPIRYHDPLIRSTSKFSMLDDEDEEEEEEVEGRDNIRQRKLWSPELVDMGKSVDEKEKDAEDEHVDMERGNRESSIVTIVLSTPVPETSSASKGSEFELGLDVKEESDEDYPSSPFHPTPIRRYHPYPRAHSISTTPLRLQSLAEVKQLEDAAKGEEDALNGPRVYGNVREGREEKGFQKTVEFRKYLDGERSARDPRFDLKVFHWILTGCSEMQWCSSGYGIEIKDVPAFYKNVLHKEAREKRESTGKAGGKRDLPGKSSFERQLSGYGFKRVTTGKLMTIERPDLRRDNHDLLRRVLEVWQDIEHGSMLPKVKVERITTTQSLRSQVRKLESEVQQKDTKLEEMTKLLAVLAKGEKVSPNKLNAIVSDLGIDIPTLNSPGMDIDIDIDIDVEKRKVVTPVNTRKTRSKSTTIKPPPRMTKSKTISKIKLQPKDTGKGKITAKSRLTSQSTLKAKSTNVPIPTPSTRSEFGSANEVQGVKEEVTPLKSIGELVKNRRGRKRF